MDSGVAVESYTSNDKAKVGDLKVKVIGRREEIVILRAGEGILRVRILVCAVAMTLWGSGIFISHGCCQFPKKHAILALPSQPFHSSIQPYSTASTPQPSILDPNTSPRQTPNTLPSHRPQLHYKYILNPLRHGFFACQCRL